MNCIDCNVLLVTEGEETNRYLQTDRCLSCALQYRYCPYCGGEFVRSLLRGDQCRLCFRENPALAEYNCRVNTADKESGKRLFGVELETQVKDSSAATMKHKIIQIDDILGDDVIMKRDGSLGATGIEIVTKPFSKERQYLLWDKFLSQRPRGLISWDAECCGLHIHVSREGLAEDTIAKAVCFANASANKKFMYILSGRKANTYTKYKNKSIDTALLPAERHECINLTNRDTIEFRMFKGTLKKESIYKNIEFCDALLDFAAQSELSQAISRAAFLRFVRHQDKWPHLMAYVMCRWFGKANDLSDKIGWKPFKNCSAKNELSLTFEE